MYLLQKVLLQSIIIIIIIITIIIIIIRFSKQSETFVTNFTP